MPIMTKDLSNFTCVSANVSLFASALGMVFKLLVFFVEATYNKN